MSKRRKAKAVNKPPAPPAKEGMYSVLKRWSQRACKCIWWMWRPVVVALAVIGAVDGISKAMPACSMDVPLLVDDSDPFQSGIVFRNKSWWNFYNVEFAFRAAASYAQPNGGRVVMDDGTKLSVGKPLPILKHGKQVVLPVPATIQGYKLERMKLTIEAQYSVHPLFWSIKRTERFAFSTRTGLGPNSKTVWLEDSP